MRAVAGYAGAPVQLTRHGRLSHGVGLAESRRFTIAVPGRLPLRNIRFSLVDVPDLQVIPPEHPTMTDIWMGAGPVPESLHRILNLLAKARAAFRLPSLERFSRLFYVVLNRMRFGEHRGGMYVRARGTSAGHDVERSWHLLAEGDDGPYIPSMAIEAVVRMLLTGRRPEAGARSGEVDFRILSDDDVRWISARGQGNDAGIVDYVMFGIFLDVTGRKQAEEAHELLAGEMSHRVKNLLAIASGLTTITSRSTTSAAEMAKDLTGRLAALGRAHDLVRPSAGAERNAALFGDLITVLLAPYDDEGDFSGRVRVSVPRIAVGEHASTNLALLLHELATNSVKYGALSVATGTLDVTCSIHEGDVALVWTERGGPPVEQPAQSGFGSKLIVRIASQLGGSFDCDWSPGGVIVNVMMKMGRLGA